LTTNAEIQPGQCIMANYDPDGSGGYWADTPFNPKKLSSVRHISPEDLVTHFKDRYTDEPDGFHTKLTRIIESYLSQVTHHVGEADELMACFKKEISECEMADPLPFIRRTNGTLERVYPLDMILNADPVCPVMVKAALECGVPIIEKTTEDIIRTVLNHKGIDKLDQKGILYSLFEQSIDIRMALDVAEEARYTDVIFLAIWSRLTYGRRGYRNWLMQGRNHKDAHEPNLQRLFKNKFFNGKSKEDIKRFFLGKKAVVKELVNAMKDDKTSDEDVKNVLCQGQKELEEIIQSILEPVKI